MAWRRGTEQKPGQAKPSQFHVGLHIQEFSAIDAADPKKGFRVRCLAASDKINSGRIRIRASAWKMRKQGAPMLYEHGKDPAVGSRALGRWDKIHAEEGTGLVAEGTVQYFEAPDPRAAVIRDIQSGLITDVSVGHAPAKIEIAKEQSGAFLDVQDTTLGEISFVAVGMDGDATYEMLVASALGFEWSDEQRGGEPPANGGNKMDRKLLIQMLNMSGAKLADDANDGQILAALQTITQSAGIAGKATVALEILGLKPDAPVETITQTVKALKEPANFVAKTEYEKLEQQLATSAIDTLIAQHKQIPEKQKEFAKTLLLQGHKPDTPGRKLFDTWVQSLPAINTKQITGGGSGAPPEKQHGTEENGVEITDEDREWCQLLGYFRDERGKDGKVIISGVDRMSQMAEVDTTEALEWLFGQAIPQTAMDKVMSDARKQQNARK